MDQTTFLQLPKEGSRKPVYPRHRRWLAEDDEWRSRKDLFDGKEEHRLKPKMRKGLEIKKLLDNYKDFPEPGKKPKPLEP